MQVDFQQVSDKFHICDALQQNREQVAQAYFEIWAIEFGMVVKNDSSDDFEIFVFLRT